MTVSFGSLSNNTGLTRFTYVEYQILMLILAFLKLAGVSDVVIGLFSVIFYLFVHWLLLVVCVVVRLFLFLVS